ncbi:MAG: DUF4398 domain-containing protein [Spirochaetes bacterium]|nr:DUF4398 domain-containing protein [Spirochaetota bacterium]
MTSRRMFLSIISCVALGFVSCDVDVPITEMVKARTTIERARTAMAEKYDNDNLTKAEDWLKKSHDYIIAKDSKNAKIAAEKAIVYADIALQTSLPQAVDDLLSDAKTVFKDADDLYAEKLAPEQFTAAGNAIVESEQMKEEQNLWDAFVKAKEAVAAGTEAKEIALDQVPQLNGEIDRLKKDAEDLGALKLTAEQKKEVAEASANLDKAQELIAQNRIKEAVPLIAASEEKLMNVKTAVQKVSAKDRIAQLRKEVEQLNRERGSEFAGEDLGVVTAALNEAESLLDQDRYDEASGKIAEAESALAQAKEKTTKGLAIDKSKSVQKLLEEVKKKDADNKFQDEIARASETIAEGNTLLESGSYPESLAKYNDAESLLYSLGVAREKDYLKDKGLLEDAEGKKIYKVIYNRQKRDCLWRIADKIYNNARLWPLIYMANKDQIKDPDLIFPGQRFVIPDIPKKKENGRSEEKDKEAVKEEEM